MSSRRVKARRKCSASMWRRSRTSSCRRERCRPIDLSCRACSCRWSCMSQNRHRDTSCASPRRARRSCLNWRNSEEMTMRHLSTGLGLLVLVAGCASAGARTTTAAAPPPAPTSAAAASQDTAAGIGPQYPSTYQRHPNPPIIIRNATIMTAAGQEIQGGSILFKDGRIVAVGTSVQAPSDAVVVDGTGKWVTPGVIDTHSHIGVYAAPGTSAESDGNEATNPVTAEVWAEHSFWPQDPQIPLAIAGGVTTIQALPGSANLIGGRRPGLKLVPARSVQEVKFPGALYVLMMVIG